MKNFISKLLLTFVLISGLALNAHAGLITTELSTGYEQDNSSDNSFTVNPSGNTLELESYYIIADDSFGEFSWLINLSGLKSLTFNTKVLGNTDYTFGKVMLGDHELWQWDLASLSSLQSAQQTDWLDFELNLSTLTFSHSQGSTANLRFIHQSHVEVGNIGVVGTNKAELIFGNIQLSRTEVPEPSSIVLFLLAIAFISRKHIAKYH